MIRVRRSIVAVIGAVLGVALMFNVCAADDPDTARLKDGSSGVDWAAYGRTFGEQHYSPLTQINAGNISKLGLGWSIDLPPGNSVAGPLEVDGTLYFVANYGVVHAADVKTGKELWQYDPSTNEVAGIKLGVGWGSRGLAWWHGKVYVGTQDGRLIAIDGKTGRQVWSAQTLDVNEPGEVNYITGAPRVFDGKIIVGFGGADVGYSRGYVSTYDAETGKLLWRWFIVPGDPAKGFENKAMEMAAKTWSGHWWKFGGGGTAWNSFSYDPDTNTVFLGTGNGTPWNHKARSEGKGDNLFLCSVVALDANTGAYKWHYQINPGESWDYTATMDMEFADLNIGGQAHKVLMIAPKNGFYYVIDRVAGKLLSAEPFAKVTWATKIDLTTGRPVEVPAARYPNDTTFDMWPSSSGAHSWYPMAFSPKTGLVYIPVLEAGATWKDWEVANDQWVKDSPIGTAQGAAIEGDPDPLHHTSRLQAWNPVTQKPVWSHPTPGPEGGGVLATAGNLVFQGQLDGNFNAFAADTGKLLWSFQSNAPVLGPAISYTVDGRQYVTVQTGVGTSIGLMGQQMAPFHPDYRTMARRMLTFVLDGHKTLPPPVKVVLKPVADPDYKLDEARVSRGARIFGGRCYQCHGILVVSGGDAPDLRASSVSLSAEAFKSIAKDGALLQKGMPRFDILTDSEVEDVRQYVRSRAQIWRVELQQGAGEKTN